MRIFSDISLWWLLPWFIAALAVSFFYYRNQSQLSDVSKRVRYTLIGLRGLALFLLGILLFGLIFESKEYKTEKPVFITVVDNSSSMLNYKDSLDVATSIEALNEKISTAYGDRFEFQSYVIDDEMRQQAIDFKGSVSDHDKAFDFIYNQYYNRNIGGICFISDGNYNEGKSPVYTAEKISLTPIFTIGVGDTLIKKDQLIRNLAVNDVAFYKNQFAVEVDIEAHKLANASTTVSLWTQGKKIAEEQLSYSPEPLDFKHVSFVVDANTVGFSHYTVKIDRKDNESSYENNVRSFYVEVIDSRSKVLILANAPHPDIAAVKQVLDRDENTEVTSKLISEWDGNLNGYALLIWHDPGASPNSTIVDAIKAAKLPVLYMVGTQSSASSIEQLGIGLSIPSGNRLDDVQGALEEGFQLFEVSDDVTKALREWPPLKTKFGKVSFSSASKMIAQRIGPVKKDDPLWAFKTISGRKTGVIVGEGIWQWKLLEYAKYKENKRFNELIQKTVQYLTVKKNTEPLRINLPNRFTVDQDVILNAEFYNSSFELITDPTISFVLEDESGSAINYEFAKKSNDYLLSLGKLKQGKYTWKASAKYDGKTYTKSGVFVVEDRSLEALSTHANHTILNQIAARTNGSFYPLSKGDELINELAKRKDIANVTYEESSFNDLINWIWLFILIVLLLAAEWGIRRYSGSY